MFRLHFGNKQETALLLLKVGLSIVFLYAAFGSFLNPEAWASYLPPFLLNTPYAFALLKLFAVFELLLVIWLMSGWRTRYAAFLCALTLIGIVISQPTGMFITFRDIGLIFMALTLAVLTS